jgi:7-cyano-7-deazaguanine synthase
MKGFIMDFLNTLPKANKVVMILSGGLDSTIAMALAVAKYGKGNVTALTFDYGQKQRVEIEKAKQSTSYLGVVHKVIDASFLGDISQGFSANVDTDIAMPTIKEVLGDPRPKTYVPNRNMILLSIAAAYAETVNADAIFCGLQATDEYSYHDTTPRFVGKLNDVLDENRIIKIKIYAPFGSLSKKDELKLLAELGDMKLVEYTLTCYNPNHQGESCGKCPSCAERIGAFMANKIKDPIPYSVNIPWVE